MFKNWILTHLLLVFFFSFQSFAQDMSIQSNPTEAEIFVMDSKTGRQTKIGKTPFKQAMGQVTGNYVKGNAFLVVLKKKGFEPYRFLFTKTANVDLELTVQLEVSREVKNIQKHDELINDLFDVQRLIRNRSYSDALGKLDTLEKDFKYFSVIPELKATTYYLQRDVEKALAFYRKAFSTNPKNIDAYKMKVYLEKKLGVSSEGDDKK